MQKRWGPGRRIISPPGGVGCRVGGDLVVSNYCKCVWAPSTVLLQSESATRPWERSRKGLKGGSGIRSPEFLLVVLHKITVTVTMTMTVTRKGR